MRSRESATRKRSLSFAIENGFELRPAHATQYGNTAPTTVVWNAGFSPAVYEDLMGLAST
jgi:hypothetical protein